MFEVKDLDYIKIINGSYSYFHENKPYSEENFLVYQHSENESYLFLAEIISRLPSGELLKINTWYEVNSKYSPIEVIVEKTIGTRKTTETFKTNRLDHSVTYTFKGDGQLITETKDVNGNFAISTPAFSTSAICILQRNINPLGRTKYNMLISENDWTVSGNFKEDAIYFDGKSSDKETITIKSSELKAKVVHMYKFDIIDNQKEEPVEFFLSKHFNIPYQVLIPNDIKIIVDKLERKELASVD